MKMLADSNDWRERRLREWLLLLLRFAVTRDPADRFAALAMAEELDSLGARWRPAAPRFFEKTSIDVCDAIAAGEDSHSPVLRRHLGRIDDPRLRRAFAAAVGGPIARRPRSRKPTRRMNQDLWKGLQIRPRTSRPAAQANEEEHGRR
jgi:hypothetical protein